MRPNAIRWFDRLMLAVFALSVLGGALNYPAARAQLASNAASARLGSGFLIGIMALTLGIILLFWYLIARRASNVAKWIWIVLFVIGLAMLPSSLGRMVQTDLGPVKETLGLINAVLQGVAIFMLFRPDARAWFAAKGKPVDAHIFD